MKKTYRRFELLLKKHNTNAYTVGKACGIASSTMSEWKSGKYTPKADKLKKIADYFGVSISYFFD